MSATIRASIAQATSWGRLTASLEALELAAVSEVERWLARSGARCTRALEVATAPADRAALLRELVRLADGEVRIARVLVGDLHLDRFGLVMEQELDGTATVRFKTTPLAVEGLPGFESALRLDVEMRRRTEPVLGDAFLSRLSPFVRFKSLAQRAALRAVVAMPPGATLIASLPTGWGKSSLFQLGTRWWRESTPTDATVVIVPTVALALDHERTLRGTPGLESSRAITGEMGESERTDVMYAFARGEVPVLLLSPEMALGACRKLLLHAAGGDDRPEGFNATIGAFVIDEAHIVESWGRNFRPDFQRLPSLVLEMNRRTRGMRVLLLSATIGQDTQEFLVGEYADEQRPVALVRAREPRSEFDWVVGQFGSKSARQVAVLRAIDLVPRPAIVYTTEVDDASDLHDALAARGYGRLAVFSGELQDPGARRSIVERWNRDEIDIVVGTSAFGMGVDKQDVRTVIHACVPEDAQRLYQEIGRGGRDGYQALALSLWTQADLLTARSIATKSWLGVDKSIKRWRAIVRDARDGGRFSRRVDGTTMMRVRIDVQHEDLGRHSGEHNRRWNMTLLVLLQRAGALTVVEIGDATRADEWVVSVDDPRLLDDTQTNARVEEVVQLAVEERLGAEERLELLERLLSGDLQDCWMCALFDLVEGEPAATVHCGRCPGCREMGAEPQHVITADAPGVAWTDVPWTGRSSLPLGSSVLHPTDIELKTGLPRLLAMLCESGIEQFAVHTRLEAACLNVLVTLGARRGFVVQFPAETSHVARMPTAVLVPARGLDGEVLRQTCMELRARFVPWPELPLVFVLAPVEAARGIPLSQHLSARAPILEADLMIGTAPEAKK